ncbi:hypothetical protein GCM10023195_62130 [Actinoallomurus liliacearum]|uniref:Uncharacterized protein n=1 Tax=Actinoallomurus liliacearum TaxID=1080073 RepID=A0ABP8TQS5_9ACTN
MTDATNNFGIAQSGDGQIINLGAMAVGRGARVTQHQAATAQALHELQTLHALLNEQATRLPEASRADAETALSEVADELERTEPDRTRLAAALSRLTGLVKAVAPLAETAESLRQTIEKIALS